MQTLYPNVNIVLKDSIYKQCEMLGITEPYCDKSEMEERLRNSVKHYAQDVIDHLMWTPERKLFPPKEYDETLRFKDGKIVERKKHQ